jgi:hypothetical protein
VRSSVTSYEAPTMVHISKQHRLLPEAELGHLCSLPVWPCRAQVGEE